MKVRGAGWVSAATYGAARSALNGKYDNERMLHRSLAERGVFSENLEKAGRFNGSTRRAFCAAALALYDSGESSGKANCAVIGSGSEECLTANRDYFSDYAGHGRQLARANLFIYTLPTSPLAEISIHFKLGGPLFFTQARSGNLKHLFGCAAGLMKQGDADQVLALLMEKEYTAAMLLEQEPDSLPENLSLPETPKQLTDFLKEII